MKLTRSVAVRFFWKRTIVKRNILGIVLFLAGCMVPAVYGDVRSGGSGAQSPFDLTGGASSDGENVHDSGEIFLYRPGSISTGDDEGPAAVHDLSMKAAGNYVPALQVGEWIKGGPFTLGDGTIYLVEFWATWCPHCANAVSILPTYSIPMAPRVRLPPSVGSGGHGAQLRGSTGRRHGLCGGGG